MTLSVFLSHARKAAGRPETIKLRGCLKELEDENIIRLFVDDTDIKSGEDWQVRIAHAITGCDLALLALTPEFHDSQWCAKEMQHAVAGDKAIPVLLEATSIPAPVEHVEAIPRDESGLRLTSEFEPEILFQKLCLVFDDFAKDREDFEEEPRLPARFRAVAPKIRQVLSNGHCSRFRLMARTGLGWWTNFKSQFTNLTPGDGKSQVMVLNPDSDAFKPPKPMMPFWQSGQDWRNYRKKAKAHIDQVAKERLELRLLDVLIPLSLLIVEDEVEITVFVEELKLGESTKESQIRQLTVRDGKPFNDLLQTFDTLWTRCGSTRKP